jgi:hypothetical protein
MGSKLSQPKREPPPVPVVFKNPVATVEQQTESTMSSSTPERKSTFVPGTTLLIIDPQIDFHPEGGQGTPFYHAQGSLAVAGANEDSERTAKLILDNINDINEIIVTLDSHHVRHSHIE